MSWREYPRYKDSGVEWLGDVPEHWHILPLKYTSSLNDEVLSESTDPDYEIQYVDITNVNATEGIKKKEIMRFEEAPSRARRRVRDGDVIISTVRTYLRAIAPVHNPEENLIVSTGFAVVRPIKGVNSHFAAHALRAPHFVEAVVARSVGVSYPAVNASEIGCLRIALPPDPEQRGIAAFLDRETERIDTLMEKKRRQIELLQEKRAALISHAVTRGLQGLIPVGSSHARPSWQDAGIGRVIKLQRGFDITGASESDGQVPVISSGGISGYSDKAMVKGPGVIVGRKGTLGTVYYVEEDYWPHDTTLWVKEFRGNLPRYVYYFLIHMKLEKLDVGAANPTLNRNHVHPIKVRWPDRETQEICAKFLDRETSKIDSLIAKVQESIDRLKEYRTALISAAVTGRIDVREEAA